MDDVLHNQVNHCQCYKIKVPGKVARRSYEHDVRLWGIISKLSLDAMKGTAE